LSATSCRPFSIACEYLVGLGRQTFYDWRSRDAEFSKGWDQRVQERRDWYEDRLREASADGNVTATIVGLKMSGRFVEPNETRNLNMNFGLSDRPLRGLADEQLTLFREMTSEDLEAG
jgi:hypothetical protein